MRRLGLLLALLLAAGCASGDAPRSAAEGGASRLLVGLGLEGGSGPSQDTLAQGGAVGLVLFVENRGTAPVRVTYPSGQAYDLVVSRDGREVWRWSSAAGMTFTQALRDVELAPGARLVYREAWPGVDSTGAPVPPGRYEARGVVPLSPRPLETPPLAITVAPR